MIGFTTRLASASKLHNSLLCVGLDTNTEKVQRAFAFNKKIIAQTHDLVCAYKVNSAFYEATGIAGIRELKKTSDYIKKKYPKILLIIDAKRGDIGNTNAGYVRFVFDYLGGDAVTLHPYLGREALQPFLDRKDKGCFVLCRTSNPGSGEFQETLFETVAKHVVTSWNTNGNCGLVVGATFPRDLANVRRLAPSLPILVPGIGAQGGDLKKTMKAGLDKKKSGVIINASRSVINALNPRKEAMALRDAINTFRYG